MFGAHFVPGYFAAVGSKPLWQPEWTTPQRAVLWGAAVGSTVMPDFDVIYNILFRGFLNHSVLWTHSIFMPLGFLIVALLLWRNPYWRLLFGLIAFGWASHLVLDVIAHGTPLLYPLSMWMAGDPPPRVVMGGWRAYITDPIFLFEPLLFAIAGVHWFATIGLPRRVRVIGVLVCVNLFIVFMVVFLILLPRLQRWAG